MVGNNNEVSSAATGHRPRTKWLGASIVAISVALMLASEAGAALALLFWAVEGFLGLPYAVFIAGNIVAGIVAAVIAVVLFVRVYRVERRLALGQPTDDIGWEVFSRR